MHITTMQPHRLLLTVVTIALPARLPQRSRCLSLLALVFALLGPECKVNSAAADCSPPIVCGHKIVFVVNERDNSRLICISRNSGARLWERSVVPHTVPCYYVPSDPERCMLIQDTHLAWCYLYDGDVGKHIYLEGEGRALTYWGASLEAALFTQHLGADAYMMSVLDSSSTKRKFNSAYVGGVVLDRNLALLRRPRGALEVVSVSPHTVRWSGAMSRDNSRFVGLSVVGYVIVGTGSDLVCVDQKTWSVAAHRSEWPGMVTGTVHIASIAAWNTNVIAWLVVRTPGAAEATGRLVCIQVPTLEWRFVGKVNDDSLAMIVHADTLVSRSDKRTVAINVCTGVEQWCGENWRWECASEGELWFSCLDQKRLGVISIGRVRIDDGRRETMYEVEYQQF